MSETLYKRILTDGLWVLLGKIIVIFAGLISSLILARVLSLNDVGLYFMTVNLVGVGVVFAQFGLHQTALSLVADAVAKREYDKAKSLVGKVYGMCIVMSVIVALGINNGIGNWIAVIFHKSSFTQEIIFYASIWIIVQSIQGLMAETIRAYRNIGIATAVGGFASSMLTFVILSIAYLLNIPMTLKYVLVIIIISIAASIAIGYALFGYRTIGTQKTVSIKFREILQVASPIFASNMAYLLSQMDIWVVGFYRREGDIAVYGASAKLVTLISMALLLINSVIAPIMSEYLADNKLADLQYLLRRFATISGALAILILLVFVLWGESILGMLYGQQYKAGYIALILLGIGQLINVWSGSCGYLLLMAGRTKIMMIIMVPCAVIALLISVYLVQSWGVNGVAFAVMFGMALQNILMWICAKKYVGVWTHFDYKMLSIEARNLLRSA